jgi:hypothetical protein
MIPLLLDPSAAKCARKRRPGRYRRDKNRGQQQQKTTANQNGGVKPQLLAPSSLLSTFNFEL